MNAALQAALAALEEGAAGSAGQRAVEELAGLLGAGGSMQALAEAAGRPEGREAVRAWGDRVADLLDGDPQVAGAVAAAMERHTPGSAAAWYRGDHTDFRGGVFLREVIGLQVVVHQAAAAPEALASLPPRPGGFTGRGEETAELLRALDDSAAVLVTAVSGLGGIGKTALAVEVAHQVCGEGRFPGGVLFVDLHGYDDEPVSADQALQSLLRALGVPPEHIPATADDRAALYRSVLARRGPVLLLADNASSPDQVRPLLPGEGRHRVLVTSRDRLTQLGARLVPLDQLTLEAAQELLDLALRIAEPEDGRAADDPAAAGRLAALCGYLPLALQIAAALLTEDLDMPVAELVGELEASHDRLSHLDDGERSVRAAFELSYRRLPPEQARLLRLLALAPGPEVSDEVAAALMGAEAPPLPELRALARAHLVERGSGRGWWRLHDLVRVFGAGVVAAEEGPAARERVLRYYRRWADAADQRLRWLPGQAEPERFADRRQALSWLDAERAGLVAAALWAREERFSVTAGQLALCLGEYLDWRRYFDDKITIFRVAQEAAFRAGAQVREAGAWCNLGIALLRAGQVEDAVDALARARDLFEAAGKCRGAAMAWDNLGLAVCEADRVDEAVEAHTRARDLFRAAKDSHGEAMAWNNLGLALRAAGRVGKAIDAHTRAQGLHEAAGDRLREARAWHNLAIALREAGRTREAIEAFGHALKTFQQFEDWHRAGHSLIGLAVIHEHADRPAQARTFWLQAVDAYTRANAVAEVARAQRHASRLTSPTDRPTPAAPPARTTDSARPAPPPPGAPDTAGQ
ncbi:ATP-binding protein [Streptomyces sp. NPDC096205]|uniref:ATP-binding protein n=1 Tax=Streptomyces sp. NPDC096205 TaxID=3366081 RepID=UPI00382E3393